MELSALLDKPIVLPSIPKVIALLLSELRRDPPDLRQVTQLISADPVLTTGVLQAANAPRLGLSGKVHSAAEALAVLDLGDIRQMATAAAASVSLRSVPGMPLPQFWNYSLNVARLARSLAGITRQNPGAAFTCGLIHAVGELLMQAGMPVEMSTLNRECGPLDLRRASAEMQHLGYNYAQVGGAYARRSQFPQPIVDALEHQHAPFSNDVYEPLAGVIHLATWRARAMEAGLDARGLAVTFPGAVGEVLDLDIDMVLQQDPIDWSAQ
jgi:HD-like signal output (HDOD) protein